MESAYFQIAYMFGQIVGVFVIVFVFVIFPILGIIKHSLLKRRKLESKVKKHDPKSSKM